MFCHAQLTPRAASPIFDGEITWSLGEVTVKLSASRYGARFANTRLMRTGITLSDCNRHQTQNKYRTLLTIVTTLFSPPMNFT